MNWLAIEQKLREEYHARADLRSLQVARRIHRMLKKRHRAHTRLFNGVGEQARLRAKAASAEFQIREVAAAILSGMSVVVIDCEWHRKTLKMTEIGIVFLNATGYRRCAIYIQWPETPPVDRKAIPADAIILSPEEARVWVMREIAVPDVVIGQAIKNDFKQLKKFGVTIEYGKAYDTFNWSTSLYPTHKGHSLTTIAERLGCELLPAHIAINDAEMTMAVTNRLIEAHAT